MSVMGGSSVAVSGGSTIANSTAGLVRCSMTRSECACVRVAVPMLWAAGGRYGWRGWSVLQEGGCDRQQRAAE